MVLISFMVALMIEGIAFAQDWKQFNSSVLVEVTRSDGVFTSSGVVVSSHTIITAGHSLAGDVKKVRISLGEHYDSKGTFLEVASFKVHPDYNPKKSRYYSDVAKIMLKEKINSSILIYPIYEGTVISGNLFRLGFGERDKKNNRTIITPTFREINPYEKFVVLNDMYSRSGDSGGPVYVQQGTKTFILAIHSTLSSGPEGVYSYNPLLAPYLSWIYQN
jgi:hypothetical protein